MSLDQLTQEGDDPAYTNRFFSGTLPTPTGKIANFLNQLSQEDQVTTAGHLFQVLKDSAGEKLFQLNAPGNTTQPLAALVMFPDSSKVRLVYGPELGMARIGSSSDLQDKLLWLMNEMEDNGASPQALVLPEEYVVSTNTMGRDTNLFKAATKTQLEKPSFAHSDTDNVEWEVMRIAPIPAYLALDAIKNPVEAADILERLENVHAPVGNPANMLQHLKKFLLTAWVKHNQKKSARLESTDFMAGYSADATAWARGKTTQMFPQQQTPATPTTGMDAVLIQQLLLQNQGLVQQLQSPPQPATTTKEEKSWSESEVKRILTMCGKAHKNTFEDNIKELPPIFREVQKERNKALQVALVKEQLDGNKHFKDAPSPNNPELYDVFRKRVLRRHLLEQLSKILVCSYASAYHRTNWNWLNTKEKSWTRRRLRQVRILQNPWQKVSPLSLKLFMTLWKDSECLQTSYMLTLERSVRCLSASSISLHP